MPRKKHPQSPKCCRQTIAQPRPLRSQVWLGKTVADFATYKAIVLGDGSMHSTTDGAHFAGAA